VGHEVVTWEELIGYSPNNDLSSWIEAVRSEIENWAVIIANRKQRNDTSDRVEAELGLLTAAIRERAAQSPNSGLVKLTSLFAQLMVTHLNDVRVTLKRDSAMTLIQEIEKNLEA
jgi:hypothetical protein